jgi:hypothetical protein
MNDPEGNASKYSIAKAGSTTAIDRNARAHERAPSGIDITIRGPSPSISQCMVGSALEKKGVPHRVVESLSAPFKHCIFSDLFSPSTADALLARLESAQSWRLVREAFYELDELAPSDSFFDGVPEVLTASDLVAITDAIEHALDLSLERRVKLMAHRIVAGQGIGLHSDSSSGGETHRLAITLNRNFEDLKGGNLVFFKTSNVWDIHRIFRPVHNSAVCFELVPYSFHAVSDVISGVRYSIVISFWSRKPACGTPTSFDELMERGIHVLRQEGYSDSAISNLRETALTMLHDWQCSKDLSLAGLFHTVYGGRSVPMRSARSRGDVENTIGQRAEWLVYLYRSLTRKDYLAMARKSTEESHVVRVHNKYIIVTSEDFRDLVTLDFAETLEQLNRAEYSANVTPLHHRYFEELRQLLPSRARRDLSRLSSCGG